MNHNSPILIRNEQGILNFYSAFSKCDFDTMYRMMHPDCLLDFPGSSFPNRLVGRDNIIELFKGVQTVMNGSLTFHNKWAIFKDDMVAAHWFTTGAPAHGGCYMNRGVAWYQLKNGLISEFQDFFDTEIISAFWPDGQPCQDFSRAEQLVERLAGYATEEALSRFRGLVRREVISQLNS